MNGILILEQRTLDHQSRNGDSIKILRHIQSIGLVVLERSNQVCQSDDWSPGAEVVGTFELEGSPWAALHVYDDLASRSDVKRLDACAFANAIAAGVVDGLNFRSCECAVEEHDFVDQPFES